MTIEQQAFIQTFIASQKRADRWVMALRIVVLITVLASIVATSIIYRQQDQFGLGDRLMQLNDDAIQVAWLFLGCSIGLLVSILALNRTLKKRIAQSENCPNEFRQETSKLNCVLLVFGATYFFRFCSDYWIVPMFNTDEFVECIVY